MNDVHEPTYILRYAARRLKVHTVHYNCMHAMASTLPTRPVVGAYVNTLRSTHPRTGTIGLALGKVYAIYC